MLNPRKVHEPRTVNKPCPECGEPIATSARLCRHCKSDLTLKRYLPLVLLC